MTKKSKEIKAEADKLKEESLIAKELIEKQLKDAEEKIKEYDLLIEALELEEKNKLENTLAEINKIAEDNGYFCAIVLTKKDILLILEKYLELNQDIVIAPRLYIKQEQLNKDE